MRTSGKTLIILTSLMGSLPLQAEQSTLTPFNSPQWRAFSDKALNFDDNIDTTTELAGQKIHFHTKNVTLSRDFNGIADIAPDGKLHFVSETPFGTTSLQIEGSQSGYIGYRYQVDGQEVVDQWAAEQFVGQILKDAIGEGAQEWKVHRLTLMRQHRPEKIKTDAARITGKRLLDALNNEDGFFSSQDLKITEAILNAPQLLAKRKKRLLDVDEYQGPFFLGVANSGSHRADILENGHLSFNVTRADGVRESTQYQLNNDALYQVFLKATGQKYIPGKTEQAMVDYFVRLHFKQPDDKISWLRE